VNELEIFSAALEQADPAERARYLDKTCGADATLRRRIEALLRNATEASQFLETPAAAFSEPSNTVVSGSHFGSAVTSDLERTQSSLEPDSINIDFLSPSEDPAALGTLGQYTVTEVIGRGGMGIVFKAHDTSLHRVVAIKVLAPELSGNPTARKRFLREARAAAAVVHQHVVTIHAVAEDRLPYLVMEFVDGQSLQDKLDVNGPLELKETLRIGTQIAAGLAAAHGHGVVHRDIKPANILLENGVERVRITDFGLARAVDDVEITKTGEVAGTPQYMSPEQAQGQPVDARSDLFSFGSVLYAMCTGRPPFRAETIIEAIRRVCDDAPRPIWEINPETPEWLTDIIARLLAKRPEDRFQTAAEVAMLLGQHLAHLQQPGGPLPSIRSEPSRQTVSTAPGKAMRRSVVAAIILLVVLAVLSATEATGVTQLAGSVVRIVSGEGMLVINVDDPTVQVSLDGEVLTIRGGGVEQVRLRPGQYQFAATKDGRPVKQELVSITRGGQKVVTVSRESVPPVAVIARPKVESSAFVILGGKDGPEQKFDTLAETILGASDGDTIEIRGNGPFVVPPLTSSHPLTIRAAAGIHPVIEMNLASVPESARAPLLMSRSSLIVEGVEFRVDASDAFQSAVGSPAGILWGGEIHLANCRFVLTGRGTAVSLVSSGSLQNCQFVTKGPQLCVAWASYTSGKRLQVDHCLFALDKGHALQFKAPMKDARVRITRNTFVSPAVLGWHETGTQAKQTRIGNDPSSRTALDVSGNVFDCAEVISAVRPGNFEMSTQETGDWLRQSIAWREQHNVYSMLGKPLLYLVKQNADQYVPTPILGVGSLSEWEDFWGLADTASREGAIVFATGDTQRRARSSTELLTPDDFRLRRDSTGYRAGPDGKDLGADVDLVGPGKAYERWKQTPEYQKWLTETRQLK